MTISAKAEATAHKYRGAVAAGYDGKRAEQGKWRAEDRIVREWLAPLPAGSKILDIPFGTGRFVPFYADNDFDVTGIDVSDDMLALARQKMRGVDNVRCAGGNIFDIRAAAGAFDVALSIRIMNLIDADDMRKALRELMRVARLQIIFNLRVWHPETRYRHPQRLEVVKAALTGRWQLVDNVEIHEPDFRMLRLCAL